MQPCGKREHRIGKKNQLCAFLSKFIGLACIAVWNQNNTSSCELRRCMVFWNRTLLWSHNHIIFAIIATENKYFHMSPPHPAFAVLGIISMAILTFCFINHSILALCICYNPEIITKTYMQASFALIFDSIAKASIVSGLATEYSKKFREKRLKR